MPFQQYGVKNLGQSGFFRPKSATSVVARVSSTTLQYHLTVPPYSTSLQYLFTVPGTSQYLFTVPNSISLQSLFTVPSYSSPTLQYHLTVPCFTSRLGTNAVRMLNISNRCTPCCSRHMQPVRTHLAGEVRNPFRMARADQGAAGDDEGSQFQPPGHRGCLQKRPGGWQQGQTGRAGRCYRVIVASLAC